MKSAAQNKSLGFQGNQRRFYLGRRESEKTGECSDRDRSNRFDPPSNQFANGFRALPMAMEFGFRWDNFRIDFAVWINRSYQRNPFGGDQKCLWVPAFARE